MAGAVIAVELIGLAKAFEYRLGAVDLVGVGVLIVIAEHAKKGAAQSLGEINGCHRPIGIELTLVVHNDIATPAIDGGVDRVELTGAQICVTTARAPMTPTFAIGLRPKKPHSSGDVTRHLIVRNSPCSAHLRTDIVRTARTNYESTDAGKSPHSRDGRIYGPPR